LIIIDFYNLATKRAMKKILTILFLVFLVNSTFSQAIFQKDLNIQLVEALSSCYACAWADYDNDGYLDVVISGSSITCGPCNLPILLFHNNADGTFTRVTSGPIANFTGTTYGLAWGDYDNDGKPDLYVCTYIFGHNLLFHNEGSGNFTQVNTQPIVPPDSTFSRACAWADYDRDGWLDLFVVNDNYKDDMLFHNNGNGTFSKITTGAIVNNGGSGYACSWADFNNDGWPDLYVVNHIFNSPDYLYINNGNGTFTIADTSMIPIDESSGRSVSWGDYDNDGYFDIVVPGDDLLNRPGVMYHNEHGSHFTFVNSAFSIEIGRDFGSSWGDYDNDGFLDLFVTRCDAQPNLLFKNSGGNLVRVKNEIPGREYSSFGSGYMCSWIDYMNNGKLNLFVLNSGSPVNNYMYNNTGSTGNYLICKLIGGCNSNAMGIGARVSVYAGDLHQIREVTGGNGAGGQDSPWPHFGLGDHTMADSVIVSWPIGNTDKIQKLTNVPANQLLIIEECLLGTNQNQQVPVSFGLRQNYPNPFNPVTRIEYSLAKNTHLSLIVYDMLGKVVKELVNSNETSGSHTVNFDGSDLASGVYVYKITADGFTDMKKMILLK
jgi:hypothetical protein